MKSLERLFWHICIYIVSGNGSNEHGRLTSSLLMKYYLITEYIVYDI